MTTPDKYLIRQNETVLDALKILNTFGKEQAQTLFVIDDDRRMVGTITDGDIRRKLVAGLDLSERIKQVMHASFHFLQFENISVRDIHLFKDKGIELIPILDKERHVIDVFNLKLQKSYLPIDAVLMAGGKGERLRPLTEKTPKPLLKLGDKAIIDHNIDALIDYGVNHISVTVNYLQDQLKAHFIESRKGIRIDCVSEPKFLGTIGSIQYVKHFFNDTVLLMNSDLFTNINYEDFYLHFLEHDADVAVAAVPYTVSVPYGIFDLDGRNIRGVLEKPTYNYYANAGIYLIKRKLLELIPDDVFFDATDFLEMLICKDKKIIRFPIIGYWIDIGRYDEYARAQDLVKHINK